MRPFPLPGSRIWETRETTEGSAEPVVRIHLSPAGSQQTFGSYISGTADQDWRCGWARIWRPGGAQPSPADAVKIKAPINAQYGELDTRITEGWPAFDAALTEAHVPHEGHIYKGANHGFHNDTTPRYDEAAAKEAWQSTLDWFNRYLR